MRLIENRQHSDGPSANFARTVAVTGGTGLIGRRLVPALQGAGADVRLLTHSRSYITSSEVAVTEVRGDLIDAAALRSLVQGTDAVVHLAAVAHTRLRTPAEEADARRVNVEGTRLLLQSAEEAGVGRFVLLSSAHVYAGQQGLDLDEDSPKAGDTVYGALKLEAEQLAAEAQSRGLDVTIVRPCLTYGPGVRFNMQGLLRAVRRGIYLQVRGADTIRSFASVDTVAAAIVHLLGNPGGVGAFNIADAEPVHLERWVDQLAERLGVRRPLAVPRSALEAVAAVGTAASVVGLRAPITRDSLRKLLTPFSLSTRKLAATGFRWPDTQEDVIGQMIDAEFGNKQAAVRA